MVDPRGESRSYERGTPVVLPHIIWSLHVRRPLAAFPVVWYKFVNLWRENESNDATDFTETGLGFGTTSTHGFSPSLYHRAQSVSAWCVPFRGRANFRLQAAKDTLYYCAVPLCARPPASFRWVSETVLYVTWKSDFRWLN